MIKSTTIKPMFDKVMTPLRFYQEDYISHINPDSYKYLEFSDDDLNIIIEKFLTNQEVEPVYFLYLDNLEYPLFLISGFSVVKAIEKYFSEKLLLRNILTDFKTYPLNALYHSLPDKINEKIENYDKLQFYVIHYELSELTDEYIKEILEKCKHISETNE